MSIRTRFPRMEAQKDDGWLPSWLSWRPTSEFLLCLSETRLLSRLQSQLESFFVPIFDSAVRIRTLIVTRPGASTSARPGQLGDANAAYTRQCPIVMLHGMGAGVAMWVKNLDELAKDRPVFCIDLLGFGRSSRSYDMPPVANDHNCKRWLPQRSKEEAGAENAAVHLTADLAEEQMVRSIEEWREQMRLPRFVLLGHSFGGYIAYAYAIRYPHRVSHLILADPWGFPEFHNSRSANLSRRYSLVFRLVNLLLIPFNPLGLLRCSGPLGPMLVRRFRQDLGLTFNGIPLATVEQVMEGTENNSNSPTMLSYAAAATTEVAGAPLVDEQAGGISIPPVLPPAPTEENADMVKEACIEQGCIFDYIYHCNAQYPASGEAAFKSMSKPIGWAVRPMLKRVHALPSDVPLTFVYGGRSWMDPESGWATKFLRGAEAHTEVQILEGAGHHVYAQAHEEFNALARDISNTVEQYTEEELEEFHGQTAEREDDRLGSCV